VTKLEYENRQFVNKIKEWEVTLEKADDAMREKDKAIKQVESLSREVEQLSNLKEAEDTFALKYLEGDKLKLSKSNDKLRSELSDLFAENSRIKLNIQKANKKIDSLKNENKKVALMEMEREDLLDKMGKMSINLENLTASSEKQEEQEQKLSSVTFENTRLNRQNQTLNRKLEEVETENKSVESENQKLQKTIENLKTTARRVEQLEIENFELESNQHKLDRENKSLLKEADRLKQGGDVKDVLMEELNSKLIGIEREKNKLMRDLEQWNGEQSKVFELEQENRKLTQSCSVDKKTLIQLRHELVDEKIKCDNLTNNMDTLHRRLQKIGIDANTLDDEADQLSQDRVKNLEGSMNRLLESRQKQVEMQEMQLKAVKEKNISLQQQLEVLKLKVQAGDAKSGIEAQLGNVVKERDQLRTEVLNIKMEANSNNKKIDLYENKLKQLQEANVQIQVENSTLQSQSTSLLSQINSLQTTNVTLETAKRRLEESEKLE
jgi:chromosome segregation ATPase